MPQNDPSLYLARMLDMVARVRRAKAQGQQAPPLADSEGEALPPKDA